MNTITVSTGVPIQLGYQYDDYATEVVFPSAIISQFTTTYGSGGTFAIWYRRSGDATGYPIGNPLVVFDGSTVTWTVVETDVANPGQAQVQLRYIKDEHCVMSQMFTAIVEDSVDIGTEIPEPMEQWADAIIKAGSGGQPTAVTSSSSMTSHSAIYLYMGSEGGYQYGHIYYWDGTSWEDGGAYGSNTSGSGLTEDVKQALLDCFANVAWKDTDGQEYYDALEDALYPPVELQSITATYTQSGTVYDTDTLDSLKADLVVTANYDNGTSATVTTYTLSGTLTEGTSTITVSYGGKTTTFSVVVAHDGTVSDGIYTPSEVIRGQYIDDSGVVTSTTDNSGYFGDYIELENNAIYLIEYTNHNTDLKYVNWRISEYDSNKTFISQVHYMKYGYANPETSAYTPLHESTKYIRLGWYEETSTTFVPSFRFTKQSFTRLPFALGGLDSSTGNPDTVYSRIHSDFISATGTISFSGSPFASSWESGGGYAFRCYNSSKAFLSSVTYNGQLFTSDCSNVSLPANTAYVRVFMNRKTNYTFANGWAEEVINNVTINGSTYRMVEE